MSRILLGVVYAVAASIGFSLLFSLAICFGADPEVRKISDAASPLLGIFTGAYFAARNSSWKNGAWVSLILVAAWIEFWMYIMARWNPLEWIEEGVAHLTLTHLLWWAVTIVVGVMGGLFGRCRVRSFFAMMFLVSVALSIFVFVASKQAEQMTNGLIPGSQVERLSPPHEQTTVYALTFDFTQQSRLAVKLYDCDSDDASPYDGANTTYMGQSLAGLVEKLDYQAQAAHRKLLCLINGGFFGASGFSIAHHEEPIVQNGRVLYQVDSLRPKDQAWFFAVNSPTSVMSGQPRFSMSPSIPWERLEEYQTVLGGVRPLRFEGNSISLKPGAGATTLQCSRTSIGWSADGTKFYVLVVHDPDSEGASQLQRKLHWPHAGGWDVRTVQRYWEQKGVPFAVLLDGGESTQLAFRTGESGFREVPSGYEYSYTLGYLFQRPLLFNLPILPPSEGHRGVLDYLYVEGPVSR